MSRQEILSYTRNGNPKREPSSNNEIIVQRAFADVLGLDTHKIGMEDNFADLGGNSLIARRLVSVARREGLSVTVADIF